LKDTHRFLEESGVVNDVGWELLRGVLGNVSGGTSTIFDCLDVDDEAIAGDSEPELLELALVHPERVENAVQVGVPACSPGVPRDFKESCTTADAIFPERASA